MPSAEYVRSVECRTSSIEYPVHENTTDEYCCSTRYPNISYMSNTLPYPDRLHTSYIPLLRIFSRRRRSWVGWVDIPEARGYHHQKCSGEAAGRENSIISSTLVYSSSCCTSSSTSSTTVILYNRSSSRASYALACFMGVQARRCSS